MRVIAVDWSGAARDAARRIWLAEAADGRIIDLWNGRTRDDVCAYLIEQAARGADLAVGLDFAFSFPEWWMRACGFEDVEALWAGVDGGLGERWLRECPPPFFGRAGTRAPALERRYRRTDRQAGAKPVFQIGGAGAVGTGSLRGMPVLRRLRAAGFGVWPFPPAAMPLAVEIYPRLLTGPVRKSDARARRAYVDAKYASLAENVRASIASSEDAFDAAVSALVMWDHRADLQGLPPASDGVMLLEGAIWHPDRR